MTVTPALVFPLWRAVFPLWRARDQLVKPMLCLYGYSVHK